MAAAFLALTRARRKKKAKDAEAMDGANGSEGSSSTTLPTAATLPAPQKARTDALRGSDHFGLPRQDVALWLYHTNACQIFVAGVILFNFFAIVVEKEIDPYSSDSGLQQYGQYWQFIDDGCNWVFLIELVLNLYGSFWRPFLRSGWNYLDTIVVVVGVTSLARVPLGPLAQIKMIRSFRILRLFKRVESLNKIIVALTRSIPGVINAFLVMLIVMMIFAIVAVELFRDFGVDGQYTTTQTYGEGDARWGQGAGMHWSLDHPYTENTTVISAMTPRGYHYGQEYYGTFFRSLYTLFQVLTGESWSEAVVRPLLFGYTSNAVTVGVFFTLYILLMQVVLQNVVVAVLLDKFVEDPDKDGDDAGEEGEEAEDATATSTTKDGGVFGGDAKPITDAAAVSFQMASTMATPEGMAELAARVQGVEAKLDQVLSLLKALDKKGGPSA